MTCHNTKDNAGLKIYIPFSKTMTIILVYFLFLSIVFYWNKNLKLYFSLADTAAKNRQKYLIITKLRRLPCLFRDFFKYKTFVSCRRPYFTPVRAEVAFSFEKLTNEPS